MADNYLEKRMEEYRAGKLAPKRSMSNRPALKLPPVSVLLTQLPADTARAVADMLVAVGTSVYATADCDIPQGCGVRIYPDIETVAADCTRRGTEVDCVVRGAEDGDAQLWGNSRIIAIRNHEAAGQADINRDAVTVEGGQPRDVALMVLALAHSSAPLQPQTIHL